MKHPKAERAGPEPAEDTVAKPTLMALPLYGSGSYRSANAHLFASDASLRWTVDQHRAELVNAGAIGLIAGRMVAFLPIFDQMIMKFAREAVGHRLATREAAFKSVIDAVHCTDGAGDIE
jgi:hypothetical protein